MKCAIVDLGSNTIRLSLYNTLENGSFETLFSKKYMAGLAGYVSHGIMSNDGINQACAVLLDFKVLLQQLGVNEMHVFATASLRNIKNTEKALETIKRRTGLCVDVIAGSERRYLRLLWCPVHNRFKERYYVRYWWWKYRIRSCKKWKSKKIPKYFYRFFKSFPQSRFRFMAR